MEHGLRLFSKGLHYYRHTNVSFANYCLESFLEDLNDRALEFMGSSYKEEPLVFPLKVTNKHILVLFRHIEKQHPEDIMPTDILLYHPEQLTYTKIYVKHGIQQVLNTDKLQTHFFLLEDNYAAIELKESGYVDIDDVTGLFLVLRNEEKTEVFTEEQLKDDIQKRLTVYQNFC